MRAITRSRPNTSRAVRATMMFELSPLVTAASAPALPPPSAAGYGRELFGWMRRAAGPADAGACTLFEAA